MASLPLWILPGIPPLLHVQSVAQGMSNRWRDSRVMHVQSVAQTSN